MGLGEMGQNQNSNRLLADIYAGMFTEHINVLLAKI